MKRILSILLSLAIVLTLITGGAEEVKAGKQILFRNTENKSIELRYVDEAGNLVNGPYGYAIVEYLYEEGDLYPSKIRYLDKNGERVLNEAGYAVAKYTYKEDGTVRQVEFYNEKGREDAIPEGYSRIQIRYKDGKPSLVAYLVKNREVKTGELEEINGEVWWTEDYRLLLPDFGSYEEVTPAPTETPMPEETPTATASPAPEASNVPTEEPEEVNIKMGNPTGESEDAVKETLTATATPAPRATPTATATAAPEDTQTPAAGQDTVKPTGGAETATPGVTATATPRATPTPTAIPIDTPTFIPAQQETLGAA